MTGGIEDGAIDWHSVAQSLDEKAYAATQPVLSVDTCRKIHDFYDDPQTKYRSTIQMARYNFGSGEYKYFDYPLPAEIQSLRETLYEGLAPIANDWERCLGNESKWPATLSELIQNL